MQNASPTSTVTLKPAPPRMAMKMASTPMPSAATRATHTSSCSESRPLRITFDHRSCAIAPEAEMTSPATTARIVASATADTMARKSSPPVEPSPPPSSSASTGTARLPDVPAASSPPVPRMARAPMPTTMTIRKKEPIRKTAQPTELRAAFASGTVKNRIRMCGRPAVPSRKARPKEIRSRFGGELEAGLQVGVLLGVLLRRPVDHLERVEAELGEHPHRQHDAGRTSAGRP